MAGGWNYRVVHRRVPATIAKHGEDVEYEDLYAVHEVYYRDDGTPRACTEEPVPMQAESMTALQETKMNMNHALRLPVLEWADFIAAEAE